MAERPFRPPSYLEANWLSRTYQWYLNPLFSEGYKRRLEPKDVPEVLPWDKSAHLGSQIEKEWEKEHKKKNPSFVAAMLRMFRFRILTFSLWFAFAETLKVLYPLLVNQILDFFQGHGVDKNMAYVYGTLLALGSILYTLPSAAGFQSSWCVGMQARAAASALIFRKLMSMEMGALSKIPSGEILNHMATDVEKLQMAPVFLPYIWIAPLQLIIVLSLLLVDFGLAFIAGIGVLVLVITTQQVTSRFYGRLRLKIAKYTDKRIHLMNEIIAGMRVIKMYCWKDPYSKFITDIRKQEIKRGIYTGLFETQNFSLSMLSAKLVVFSTIAVYVMTGNVLSPQKIFKLVAWMEIVRFSVTFALTLQMQIGSQAYFSAKRIQNFLTAENNYEYTVEAEMDTLGKGVKDHSMAGGGSEHELKKPLSVEGDGVAVSLQGVNAVWNTHANLSEKLKTTEEIQDASPSQVHMESRLFSLKDIDLQLKQGELVACVGPVGSGKSSLVLAILGQMPVTSGNISTRGDVAYVPQEAWVFSESFRENLLFGSPLESQRYQKTIRACALGPDIAKMPNGDISLVGERGLSLSGGQKARLNLARAVYRDADIYLLDDPLSAVDAKVGKHLFQKCIREHLEGKTRLLVTHQLQYLKEVDRIIVLQEGAIRAIGTFEELQCKVDFHHLLKRDDKNRRISKQEASQEQFRKPSLSRRASVASSSFKDANVMSSGDAVEVEEEERSEGAVGFTVYRKYWQAGKGAFLFTLLCCLLVISKFLYVFVDWWIAKWATWYLDDYPVVYNASNREASFVPTESYDYLYTYAGILALLVLVSAMEGVVYAIFTRLASRKLHDTMFSMIMRAPLAFFERNPVGRVLNRFSRDMIFIDEVLPQNAFLVLSYFTLMFAMVVFVAIVNPWALLFTLPLAIIGVALRQYGARTTREIKRIEATNRSPVYSHVTATLQGLSVIRAFGVEELMTKQFDQLQDKHTASWFTFLSCYRWLGIRFDVVAGVYMTCTVFASLLLSDELDGTLVGLSLTYILTMLGMLQYLIRLSAEVESYMTSVERILQYTKLEQEAPPHNDDVFLPPKWPTRGDITFDHVTLTYAANSRPALKDVCITIKDGEKIGVAGRSGAGKSTLITALMRLVEPKGSISIDGIDIATIGLDDVRRNISIIPQDPVLFTGTLRANLDPFSEYTDEQLWEAIHEVQLKEKVEQLPGHLYGEITEAGNNFSVGQKQLVCLARALLRKNRILLIDEATANVDESTDNLIQTTLKTRFKDCTVLTIAHRLHTIIDSDKLLVLGMGKVAQFDHPFNLLRREKGVFYEMVIQTGKEYARSLMTIAENRFNQAVASGRHTRVSVTQQQKITTRVSVTQ